jgi:hypothetical protein
MNSYSPRGAAMATTAPAITLPCNSPVYTLVGAPLAASRHAVHSTATVGKRGWAHWDRVHADAICVANL